MLMNSFLTLTENGSFNTPIGLDTLIINFFNNLGWYGNLILILLSLLLATIFGGILGYQREINGHDAGFRTHILISLGSALIMIISLYGVPGEITRDPMRLAAAGVTGMGFLGAGTIIKNGITVKGLTTAATIWVTMAIGMASGAGYFIIALISTLIALICLVSFQKIEKLANRKFEYIEIVVEEDKSFMKDLLNLLRKYEIRYTNLTVLSVDEDNDGKKEVKIVFKCRTTNKVLVNAFIEEFKNIVNPVYIGKIQR